MAILGRKGPTVSDLSANEAVSMYRKFSKYGDLARRIGISMGLLSKSNVKVLVSNDHVSMPAATSVRTVVRWWSPGEKILEYLTVFSLPWLDGKPLAAWLGVGWHELGHVLWSPYGTNVLITPALNILEDARIEMLLLVKYPKMRSALLAMVAEFGPTRGIRGPNNQKIMSDEPNLLLHHYAFVCGRIYIDRKIRDEFRQLIPEDIADRIDAIFREYMGMRSRNFDTVRAQELAKELGEILGLPDVQSGCTGTAINRPKSSLDGTEIPEDMLEEMGGDAKGGDGVPGSNPNVKLPKDATYEDLEEEGKKKKAAAALLNKVTATLQEEAKREAAEDEYLREEVKNLSKLIKDNAGGYARSLEVNVTSPDPQVVSLTRRVRESALKFNDDTGKGLVRKRDSGRLRPTRLDQYDDLDIAYDQWEPGLDQEMFIGIVMDVSGSMHSKPVAKYLYALEMGLSEVATVKSVFFSDHFYVTNAKNSATRMVLPEIAGSTEPSGALNYMHSVITRESAMNKMLILYTDGGFDETNSYEASEAFLADLRNQGVSIRVLFEQISDRSVELYAQWLGLRPHEYAYVSDLSELPGIVLDWTRTVLTKSSM